MKILTTSLLFLSLAGAASADETFSASAESKNVGGSVLKAPVTISYTGLSTPAERDAIVAALKSGGHEAARKVLLGMKDIGVIEAGKKKVTVKYAFARPMGSGRLLTVVAAEPLAALKSDFSGMQPKPGYDLTLAILVLDADGKGDGEITPAAKIKVREDGALTTEDASTETIWLKGIAKK